MDTKEAILSAGLKAAQSHGYAGINFRDLAVEVGIKAASIHYHFPTKADLGAAIARRYWEDTSVRLDAISAEENDAASRLLRYPAIFRRSLENGNRLCLCSFMAAAYDDLPDTVKHEVQMFTDINVAWLSEQLTASGVTDERGSESRARAIFAAVSGAQLFARSRADIALFDHVVSSYRSSGLLGA